MSRTSPTGAKKEVGNGKSEVVGGSPQAASVQSKRKRKASKKQQQIEDERGKQNEARDYSLLLSE